MIEIEVRGIERVVRELGRGAALETMRAPMLRGLYRLQRRMAAYPSAPTGSSYVRTGTLGRRWTTAAPVITGGAGDMVGRIGNNTTYGPFVQSEQFQARVHRGRWETEQKVMASEKDAIVKDFERAVQAALP